MKKNRLTGFLNKTALGSFPMIIKKAATQKSARNEGADKTKSHPRVYIEKYHGEQSVFGFHKPISKCFDFKDYNGGSTLVSHTNES